MGEKIRDLHPIRIGSAELMIELNEGYTKNEGRLIHIQNAHFRYLMKEKHFVRLAAEILRAGREREYAKSAESVAKIPRAVPVGTEPTAKTREAEAALYRLFTEAGVRCLVVSEGESCVTWLVNPQDRDRIDGLPGLEMLAHPWAEKAGYTYLYQMTPFRLYRYQGVLAEIYFQLPCRSLTPKTWIPFDRAVQRQAWEGVERNDNGVPTLNTAARAIYLIGWSVFQTHAFSEKSRAFLDAHRPLLRREDFLALLRTVFFAFSDRLAQLLYAGEYERVLEEFYSFDGY